MVICLSIDEQSLGVKSRSRGLLCRADPPRPSSIQKHLMEDVRENRGLAHTLRIEVADRER